MEVLDQHERDQAGQTRVPQTDRVPSTSQRDQRSLQGHDGHFPSGQD